MRRLNIAVLVLALFLAFTACDDGGTTPTLGNTPAQVLKSLMYAFNSGDIETLNAALADDFTFYFDPNDVGKQVGDYTIPATWGREDFLTACGNMYDLAFDINFVITIESVGEPGEDATEFTVNNVQIRLLAMVDAQNGFLGDGFCDFRFVNEGADGTDNWVISDWWDRTAARGTYESGTDTSFGLILAGFAQ